MLEAIINFLNLKLGLLNYFEQQHCLCELKSDNEGKVAPVEYVGDANYTVISHDEFDGVSYWRLRDKPTQDVLETKYQAGKRVEVKIPLRLVFSVRRTKLTTDDAYAFDRIRQTIVKQFNFDDGVLKTTLGCESVTVSVPTSNGDARNVWDEETSETGTYEPNYSFVYGSIDIEVAVIYKGSCLPTECDDVDSNILHAFDFCKPSVVAQLTPTQVACLEADLCISLCVQLAEVLPEDVVIDVFDCLSEAAQTELLDIECVIPPCSPVTQQVNGTTIGTTASGGTNNQLIRNTAGTAVGTAANPSVIANTTLRNSAAPTWTDSVVAGVTKTLAQGKALDSDGATTLLANYIPAADGFMFTCTPAADATVEINSTLFDTVASGATIDIPVINGGSNPVGSLQGSDWVIGNNMTTINGTQVTDQEAEVNATIFATLDGSQSGTWNAGTQTWEMTSAACDDATVTINGASLGATGTIPSGGSEDLDVLQGGSPVGSWNGSAWIIPTCPVAPSLAVTISDSTPNFGDSVTITATPTNITPTSYAFSLPNQFGQFENVTQAGNTLNWVVNNFGTGMICVKAATISESAYGEVTVVTTVNIPLASAKAAFDTFKTVSAYAGAAVNVRRTDTSTTSDVGFTSGILDVAALNTFKGISAAVLTTMYNQVGNGNIVQATANIQPPIIVSGDEMLLQGLVAVAYRYSLTMTSGLALNQTSTEYIVMKVNSNITTNQRIFSDPSIKRVTACGISGTNILTLFDESTANAVRTTNANSFFNKMLITIQYKNGAPVIAINGVVQALTVVSGTIAAFVAGAVTTRYFFNDNSAGFAIGNNQMYAYYMDAADRSTAVESFLMKLHGIS